MTTTVKVEAHCDERTAVKIQFYAGGKPRPVIIIHDGEVFEDVVHSDLTVKIKEIAIEPVEKPVEDQSGKGPSE